MKSLSDALTLALGFANDFHEGKEISDEQLALVILAHELHNLTQVVSRIDEGLIGMRSAIRRLDTGKAARLTE